MREPYFYFTVVNFLKFTIFGCAARTSSCHRNPPIYFAWLLAALLGAIPSAAQVSLTPLAGFGGADGWLAPGEDGYAYLGTASLERGMAYGNNHLYLVSRSSGDNIRILDKLTGDDLGALPLGSGIISGGTFTVNTVGVGQDGAIYVANACTPVNGSTPFRVYRWADELSPPTVAFSSTTVSAGPIGTSFDVIGAGAATRLIAGENSGAGSGLLNSFALLTTADGVGFTGSLVPFGAPAPSAAEFFSGLAFLDSTHVYGANGGLAVYDTVRYVSLSAPQASITGQWDFDAGDLSATIGNALQYRGTTAGLTQFGTTTSFGISDIGGQVAQVMRFPACSSSQGYLMRHGAAPNASSSGTKVNQYTIIMDILFPATSTGFRSLWQTETNSTLTTDGDLFVNGANAIGVSGQYQGNFTPNAWHRVVFTLDLTTRELGKYIDGANVLTSPVGVSPGSKPMQYLPSPEGLSDQRWALSTAAVLFSDENNETGVGYVNSIQFQDRVLSAAEIAALGGPAASGIPTSTAATPSGIGKILATPVSAFSDDAPMDYTVVGELPLLAKISKSDSRVRIYDASVPTNLVLLATSTGTSGNLNFFAAGAVAWGDKVDNGNGTHTAYLYAMNANNGIQAFTVQVGPCTSVTLSPFAVTGGGAQCGGATVGLAGSQIGATYLLQSNSVYAGISVEGTGAAISFGNQPVTATYTVLASNTTYGCTKLMSGSASVVNNSPAITNGPSPANFNNYQGGYISFSVRATGTGLSYQWRRDGTNLSNGGAIAGATTSTLTIFPAGPADTVGVGHGYACVVSGSCSPPAVSAEATATVIPFVAVPGTVVGVWTNRYNGPSNGEDVATAVAFDANTNALVTGYSHNGTNHDYYTAKYAAGDGALLWEKRYAGAGNSIDQAMALAVDGDGNAIVTGISGGDYYTAKYAAADGVLLWEKRFNGFANSTDQAVAVTVDGSGNVAVTGNSWNGFSGYDIYTAKYAVADGALIWEQWYPSALDSNGAIGVAADGNGNIIVSGYFGAAASDFITIKYAAADGAELWSKIYNGPANGSDRPGAMALDGNGNVVVTGSSSGDYYTAKYAAANGVLLWERRYNGPGNAGDVATALALDLQANVLVTGYSRGNGTGDDYYTAKYAAADGALLWDTRFTSAGNNTDQAAALRVDGHGNAVVAGMSYNGVNMDYFIANYAAENGAPLWTTQYDGPANGDDKFINKFSLAVTPAGDVVVTGGSDGDFGSGVTNDFLTIKFVPGNVTANTLPVVSNPIPDTNAIYGTPFTFNFAANTFSDPDPGQTLSYTASGLPAGISFTPATRTLSGTPTAVGNNSVTITATDNGSPALSTNDVFDIVIAKAPLTVTGDNQFRIYAETNPPLTFSYSAFVLGETAAVLDTPPVAGTTATNGSAVGPYPITIGGGADDHYELSYVGGTLTVTPAPLTVTAFDTNRVYGTSNPPLEGSLVGVAWSDNITATFATTATIADPPGAYQITPILSDPDGKLSNYAVTTNNATLTVSSPPELSITSGGGGLITLSWPASYGSFVLEFTESLTPPIDWQPVTSGITENGGIKSYTVVSDPNVSGRLYRLRLP